MKKALFLAFSALLLLTGCKDSNIGLVKNYTLKGNKSITIGSAIDGFKGCSSTQWQDISSKSQKAVKASCVVGKNVLEDEFKRKNDAYTKALNNAKAAQQKSVDNCLQLALDSANSILKNGKNIDKETILSIANKHCKFDPAKESGGYLTSVSCDIEFKSELAEILDTKQKWVFDNVIAQSKYAVYHSQKEPNVIYFGENTKKINERVIELTFTINTDKSVDIAKVTKIDDGDIKDINRGMVAMFCIR